MGDSDQVLKGLEKKDDVSYSCLVPNVRGMQQAVSHLDKCTEVAIFGSASETFSQKNINCSIDESMERFLPVLEIAKENEIPVRGYVSCVVGCPYEGNVSVGNVVEVAERMVKMGCYEVSLGDTIGVGTPYQVKDLLKAVKVRSWERNHVQ